MSRHATSTSRRRGSSSGSTATFATIADDFTDATLDTTVWVAGGTAAINAGKVRMATAATNGTGDSLATSASGLAGTPPDYTIKNASLSFQLVTMVDTTGATAGSTGTWIRARIINKSDITKNLTLRLTTLTTPNPLLMIGVDGTETSVTYVAASMKYFRFREASGTVYFETSANGNTWATAYSVASPTWITTAANQRAYFDSQKSTGTVPTFWELGNVNTAPSAITIPGTVTAASAVESSGTINVNWSPPVSDGGSPITGYHVFRDQPDWTSALQAPTLRTFNLSNFTAGTTYTIKVRAVNNIGVGPWTTFSVTMGGGSTGGGSGAGSGFRADMLATSPRRYYPMNSQYALQEMVARLDLSNTGGGVTFTTAGAVFQGTTDDYLTGPSGSDIQIGRAAYTSSDASVTRTQMAIFYAVTFPTYVQPAQFHFMSCGGDVRGPGAHEGNFSWAMRLYGDGGGQGRARNISAYYWNPNPSYDVDGTAVPSSRGSGAFLAPPEGERTPYNAPTGAGAIGVEHWIGMNFGYSGTKGSTGICQMYYGQASPSFPMTAITPARSMFSDANVTPVIGTGRLFIGKRGDSDGMVKATIRRVAFWDRNLTQTEFRSFANVTSMAKTED